MLVLFIGVLTPGCFVSNQKFFSEIPTATDSTYGYRRENPVTIKNGDLNNSIESSYYYLSRLRTEEGSSLELIQRFSVNNPNYKKPAVPFTNRITGDPLNYGTGPLLDLYLLKAKNEDDTVRLYINPYLKGNIRVPAGLIFEKEN